MEEVNPGLGKFLDGQFRDYSPRWYTLVGDNIVHTMMVNAFMPIVTETISVVTRVISQSMDQGWCVGRDA